MVKPVGEYLKNNKIFTQSQCIKILINDNIVDNIVNIVETPL